MDLREHFETLYETLNKFVDGDTALSEKTKSIYKSNLNKLKSYEGNVGDTGQLTELLNRLSYSVRNGILNVIIKYVKENKQLHDYYYELRGQSFEQYSNSDKSTALNGETVDTLLKKLETVPNTVYKLPVYLGLKFPCLRISDYVSLQFGGKDDGQRNFIDSNCFKVVFNSGVKTILQDKVVHSFDEETQKIVKACLKGVKAGKIFNGSDSSTKLKINTICKHIGLNNFHLLRKLNYIGVSESVKRAMNISKAQNHSILTALTSYM